MKTLLLGLSAATALAAGASAAPIDLLTHGSAGSFGGPALTSVTAASATAGAWFDASQTVLAPTSDAYTFDVTDRSGITTAVASLVDRVYVAGAPAPFSMALLGCGLVGIGLVRRRAR